MAVTRETPPELLPSFLSVAELQEFLGISRSLAYGLVAEGEVPSVRLGRRLLIPKEGLLRTLESSAITRDNLVAR
jgi:excisionase family DNA binding protein